MSQNLTKYICCHIRFNYKYITRHRFIKLSLCLKPNLLNYKWAMIGSLHTDRRSTNQHQNQNTIDKEEVDKFTSLANSWWDEGGQLKALHTLNELRVPLVRDCLLKSAGTSEHLVDLTKPLHGYKILDVGCGGGILSEPLARLGAKVTGIDASEENVKAAIWHSQFDKDVKNSTSYQAMSVEQLKENDNDLYDGVVASEIVEHVANPDLFVKACCDLAKPGGSVFFTTLNKTWLSWALAVVAAERIFKIVPTGAHDWHKFVSKEDLIEMLSKNQCEVRLVHGITLNPLTLKWHWIKDTGMNYAIHAVKTHPSPHQSDSSCSDSE